VTVERARGDSGEATTQLVLLTPVILLLVMLVVQVALASYVAHVAEAAAARGADAAAVSGATSADGSLAVDEFLSGVATPARAPVVTRDAASARAEVTLRVPHIVPFFPTEIARVATTPVERFLVPTER
jgi:zona occludens toxin (predicted ATPase)